MRGAIFALVALAVFLGFLGVLVVRVPRLDLTIVIAITVGLVIYDMWTEFRPRRR